MWLHNKKKYIYKKINTICLPTKVLLLFKLIHYGTISHSTEVQETNAPECVIISFSFFFQFFLHTLDCRFVLLSTVESFCDTEKKKRNTQPVSVIGMNCFVLFFILKEMIFFIWQIFKKKKILKQRMNLILLVVSKNYSFVSFYMHGCA